MGSASALRRAPFLALGMLSLVAGVLGGLARAGLDWSPAPGGSVWQHGALMIGGFLGTVISLERAVSVRRSWAYAAPLGTGAGGILLVARPLASLGPLLVAIGAWAMLAALADAARRHPSRWILAQLAGGACFAIGATLLAVGWPLGEVLPWWEAFLVLTIAGERLELSRLLQPTRGALHAFTLASAVLVGGAALQTIGFVDLGLRIAGAASLGLAAWLGRWDLARKSIRRPGLPRFMAVALLSGHAWLAVAGWLALVDGAATGLERDARLHALLLGFVFSMIFGHAPVIFPTVLGLPVAYRSRFWIHLGLLHAGVILRVASDVMGSVEGRSAAAVLNAAAIALFLLQTVTSLGRRAPSAHAAPGSGV
jgi:hypothetical protein